MSRASRFVELWNAGRVRETVESTAPGYSYQDAVVGGPFDKDAHVEMMEAILSQVPDRTITIRREWSMGDVEILEYRWSGTPTGGEPIESDWLAIFEFEGDALKSQRHYRGS